MKQPYKKLMALALIFSAVLSLFGCGPAKTPSGGGDKKLKIVATNFPPFDFARQLAGELADVTMLLSPGQESHTFEPTPQDIIKIQQADIFIMGGGESDQWAKKLISSSQLDEGKTLFMVDCVETVPEELTEGMNHNHEEHADEDHSGFYEYDEHVWTSPVNAMEICRKLTEKLIAADKANEQAYTENLNRYLAQLEELDESFAAAVERGVRKTLVFGDRFPFRYFADRYGLTYFAAFPGCSGETEPDAATMKFLIDKVSEENIPVVLHVELSNQKIADAICEATGAKKALLHSCHGVTKDEFDRGETYVSLMKNNVDVLKEALS
ncbi:MAG TPA: zinc ABC transporter substrate-binding protein [Clostridiales bacterium]|nr:zinc ABC transporter substrate-binding protein [Clostridiales bacterium]HBL82430.1 zinc ABC transporter substrate-binding protein [Clostridiales bacterium]